MSVAENPSFWTHRERLTGTRLDPGSTASEEGLTEKEW
jgi:hypothetical protein